jgi:phosphatidylglycerophosphate synthase
VKLRCTIPVPNNNVPSMFLTPVVLIDCGSVPLLYVICVVIKSLLFAVLGNSRISVTFPKESWEYSVRERRTPFSKMFVLAMFLLSGVKIFSSWMVVPAFRMYVYR